MLPPTPEPSAAPNSTDTVAEQSETKQAPQLFDGVTFAVIESGSLGEEMVEQIVDCLIHNGAEHYSSSSDTKRFPPEKVTHIISKTSDFPAYYEALNSMINVVKPEWVSASMNRKRLAQPRSYSPDPRLFFSGLNVAIADLPPSDYEAIAGGVLAAGGQTAPSVVRLVTHIVALTEDNEMCRIAKAKGWTPTIVLPHWFDDCFKLGRRIDSAPYELPNPQIALLSEADPVPIPANNEQLGSGSTTAELEALLGQPPRELKVLKKKKVKFCSDLDLNQHTRDALFSLVNLVGTVTESVKGADMLICRYRDGRDYVEAHGRDVEIGSLSWFYYLITHDRWTAPTRRLLHFPVPRHGVPGVVGKEIAVSNYGGEARIYLENLIKSAGARYTKVLRQENTHLITARGVSDKCEAAEKWNIHIVNHFWLEESYAQMKDMSISNPKYSHFPSRTNLGEVAGQAQIDPKVIASTIEIKDDDDTTDDEDYGTSASHQLEEPHLSSQTEEDDLRAVLANGAAKSDKGVTPANRKKIKEERVSMATPLQLRTADGNSMTPSSTSSRGAKDRAAQKLHELTDDIALYNKERKRKGGVERGGKRNPDDFVSSRKRSVSSRGSDSEESEDDEESRRDSKKFKKTLPPVTIKLLITSYSRWIGSESQESADKRLLRDLGIRVVDDPSICTHLAAPAIVRTPKFLCAMARAPIVVHEDFIDHCLDKGELPPVQGFVLKDKSGERKLAFSMQSALARAKRNKGKLLGSYTIYVTEKIQGGSDAYKRIVEANGGKCLVFKGRHGPAISSKLLNGGAAANDDDDDDEDAEEEIVYLISGSKPEETSTWSRFVQMAEQDGRVPRIVISDWLLNAAIRQEVTWEDHYETRP